ASLPSYHHLPRFHPHLSSTAPAPTEIYTLSLHDALPICKRDELFQMVKLPARNEVSARPGHAGPKILDTSAIIDGRIADIARTGDRKSTRLNSSHVKISYAVFCLKKKNKNPPKDKIQATD